MKIYKTLTKQSLSGADQVTRHYAKGKRFIKVLKLSRVKGNYIERYRYYVENDSNINTLHRVYGGYDKTS